MSYPYFLMAPGPVQIPAEVLTELSQPMIHHRTPEFDKILSETFSLLKKFFQTDQHVFIQTATGSGGMEAALVNTLSPGDKVIAIVSGKFGERWRDMAKTFGMNVISLDVKWGESANPNDLESLLKANPDTKCVITQVCETSTGTLHPIEELSKVIQKFPNCLFMVDAITAMGATPLEIKKWNLDVVVAGSQKAFMIPTGLTFLTFSEKAWKACEQSKTPRYYFDLRLEKKSNLKGESHFSSSVPLIRALRAALNLMLKEGLNTQMKRMHAMAEATRKGGEALGLTVFAKSPSPSVTSLLLPSDVDGVKLRDLVESKYNCTIAGGQDSLKGKIIRIGHLGAIGKRETVETIERIGLALKDLGHACDIPKAVSITAKTFDEAP